MKSLLYVRAYYTLFCMCAITGRRTRAAAAEADTVRAQFSLTTRDYSARQRHYCTWHVRVGGCTRLMQLLRLLHHAGAGLLT